MENRLRVNPGRPEQVASNRKTTRRPSRENTSDKTVEQETKNTTPIEETELAEETSVKEQAQVEPEEEVVNDIIEPVEDEATSTVTEPEASTIEPVIEKNETSRWDLTIDELLALDVNEEDGLPSGKRPNLRITEFTGEKIDILKTLIGADFINEAVHKAIDLAIETLPEEKQNIYNYLVKEKANEFRKKGLSTSWKYKDKKKE